MVNMPSCKQTNIYVHEIEINKSKSKSKCYTFLSDFWYIMLNSAFKGYKLGLFGLHMIMMRRISGFTLFYSLLIIITTIQAVLCE